MKTYRSYVLKAFGRLFAVSTICATLFGSAALSAHDSSGSAYGEFVDLTLDPSTGLAVGVSSGPFPTASGMTPPAFGDSDSAASVFVNAVVTNAQTPITVDVLQTGILEVATSGDETPSADSSATVNDLNLDLLGNLAFTLLFGFDADTVTSTASVSGSCGSALNATGTTVLENATASGSLSTMANVDGAVTATPSPNFVLLDLDLGILGQVTVILNEQIAGGDGVTSASITVNAIHVIATDLLFGNIIDIDGEVIIAQSVAEANCDVADLSIQKADSPDPVEEGELLTYTLSVENAGPDDADDVQVVDTLPASANFISANPSQGSCMHNSGTVSCDLGTIANGGNATITIDVIPTADGVISNTASVDSSAVDPNNEDNSDTENTTVTASAGAADLNITINDSPDPVTVGNTLTYTLTVNNAGPDDANNVQVVDNLPAGVSFDSAMPSQGSCMESAGVVTCDLGTIANGGNATITIAVIPNQAGQIIDTAVVDADEGDPNTSDNSDSETTTVEAPQADLAIDIADSPDPVTVGETLTYTLTVNNHGPDDAENVLVENTLPAGVSYGSASPSQGSCMQSAGVVTCNLGTIANGGNATITIEVTPDAPGMIVDSATVSSDAVDLNLSNNSDDEATTVVAVTADLNLTKNDSPDPVQEGETLTYTITVNNAGPDDAENVMVEDTLPGGVIFESSSPSQGSCMHVSGTVTCNLGTLANGANATVTLTVTPTADGAISNTASVSSDADDPNPDDNSDTEGTTVTAAAGSADLSISKSGSPDPVETGQTLTYTITVNNAGPDDASNVQVVDNLPASVSFDSAMPSQGSCIESAGVVTCDLGTIVNGGNATVIIKVTPNEPGVIVNTVVVDADEGDPDDGNNQDEETTTVEAAAASADLMLTKNDSPDPVQEGETLTYTITVNNAGPDDADNVMVEDTLPGGVIFESSSPSQGSCQHAGGVVSCNLGTIVNGGNATVVIQVTPLADGELSNTANAESDVDDPNPDDNSDTEGTTVTAAAGSADLSISKSGSPDPVETGQTLTYTITVNNAGPDDASNVQVVDNLPGSVSFDSATPSQGSCEEAGSVVTCDLGTIVNGGNATVIIEVTPNEPGAILNTAVVDADEGDPDDGNNSDSEQSDAVPRAASFQEVPVPSLSGPASLIMILLLLLASGTVIRQRR